jgi:hypothetical protein
MCSAPTGMSHTQYVLTYSDVTVGATVETLKATLLSVWAFWDTRASQASVCGA